MAAKATRPKDEQPEANGEAGEPKPLSSEPARPKAAPEPAPPTCDADAKGAVTLKAPAPAAEQPKTARYRVWSHGTLQRNGTTYRPGSELTLLEAEAARISCLEKVT